MDSVSIRLRVWACLGAMGFVVCLMGRSAAGQEAPPAPPPAAPAAPSPEAIELDREMGRAYKAKEYDKALIAGEALLKLRPNDPAICYNMGCIHNLMGHKADALQWIRRSAEHGFSNIEAITWDLDLRSLQGDPTFHEVIALVEKNAAPGIAAVKARIAKNNPLIAVPPTLVTSNRVPLMVALHGFGQREEMIVESVREAANSSGIIVVAPRAPQQARGGFAWTGNIETTMIIEDAIERAAAVYNIDRSRIILFGFSQGGHFALNVGLRNPEKFCGIIAVGARYDPNFARPDKLPEKLPRYFFMVGANDTVIEETRKAAADVTAMGATVKLEVYPGIGHGFPTNREAELIKAIDFVLDR